ncbi:peptidoglycan editing factor PgeF [Mesorhizobium xinjiangense]|uniref:peptidoglycan editing factor PgeF n=1 Tax=Mesorhizobium xinjiangense TaxID=2678685 RepID=UPI0012EE5613|nr:peptidoglycan editing factor PgeF [Mesorhizobium xinjiangense]
MANEQGPDPIRSPALGTLASQGVAHGYFTRRGGVSGGIYAGLNIGLGSSDERESVVENRRRVAETMGVAAQNLATLYQIHSAEAVTIRTPPTGELPRADALVTDVPGIALGVTTADCGPVLFADARARVIGAAHAGWKGALGGILEATIEAMERAGAHRSDIVAVLGPSISQSNYEVGPEFVERFRLADDANDRYFAPSRTPGHAMFDLNRYTVDRLAAAGVQASMLERCTYGEEELFYSYRRATHHNAPDYGRQISAIALEDR